MLGGVLTWPCCAQVLHLVAMALLEEQQQLENMGASEDVTFSYSCKISRQ